MVVTREKGSWRLVKCKGINNVLIEDNLTLGGGHKMQYIDHVS